MAKRSGRARRVSKQKYEMQEIFAFTVILFVIIILFSAVAMIVSATPLN